MDGTREKEFIILVVIKCDTSTIKKYLVLSQLKSFVALEQHIKKAKRAPSLAKESGFDLVLCFLNCKLINFTFISLIMNIYLDAQILYQAER